jgi:hypothetical protein
MNVWWQMIAVFFLSTVKFVFGGIPLALGFGFSYFQAVTVTTLGGMAGVTFYVYASDKLLAYFKKRALRKREKNPNLPPKKKFTKRNRLIINVKTRFGILGFSLLVPFFIPIPLGCFLTMRYFRDRQLVLRYLFMAVLFWSFLATLIYKPVFDAIHRYF